MKYGLRNGRLMDGSDRPDFVSAMVTLDVPIFQNKRQDRRLSASRHEAAAATLQRDDVVRNLTMMLDSAVADHKRISERVRHFDQNVVARARESYEAAVRAYQDDLTDFSSLMRAQVRELDARLQLLWLRVDLARIDARLLYLQGEGS